METFTTAEEIRMERLRIYTLMEQGTMSDESAKIRIKLLDRIEKDLTSRQIDRLVDAAKPHYPAETCMIPDSPLETYKVY